LTTSTASLAFSCSASKWWNSLPVHIRGISSPEMGSELLCVNNFKRTLTSFLFTIGYVDVVYLLSRDFHQLGLPSLKYGAVKKCSYYYYYY